MELRKSFDAIPEQFDKYRPRYCQELFADLIAYAGLEPGKTVLELGPGTGQATEPILNAGCEYHAIELGEHLVEVMRRKYGNLPNFHITVDDFITHDFGALTFDCIYSAATIQWIPEEVAFGKTFGLLKPGGTLSMFRTVSDYRTPNPALFNRIQQVYDAYFKPETPYACKLRYENATLYGYVGFERREYHGTREFTADEYAQFSGTHCDHIVIPEPYKSKLFDGLRDAVNEFSGRIVFQDAYVMDLVRKPV